MANMVIVFGKSGVGKSKSLFGFGADEIVLVKCVDKPLPFKGKFAKTCKSTSAADITALIKRCYEQYGIKSFVIDDAGYLMTSMFMNGHRAKSGSSSFDLYNDIGDAYWRMFTELGSLPEEVIVYMMMHETSNDYGEVKLRTIGKLLDEKICLEGLCTIVIHAVVVDGEHIFRVQAGNGDIAKSPEGMFDSTEIPNDLKLVDTKIREYYEM